MLVVLLMGLFTRSGGPLCAISTLATGVVGWIVLRYVITDYPYPWLTCLALAFAVWWLAHLLTRHSKRKPIT